MSLSPLGFLSPTLGTVIAARGAVSLASKAFSQLLASQDNDGPENAELNSSPSSPSILSGVELATLQEQTAQDLQQFQSDFRQLLAENNIDYGAGFHLQFDELGDVKVDKSHPRSSEVENLLKAHPDLANKLRKISAQSGIIQTAERDAQRAKENLSATPDDSQKIDAAKFLKMLDEAQKTRFDLRLTATAAKISYIVPPAE